MAGSDERWTRTGRHAHGYAGHGMGNELRVYYTRYFPFGVAIYGVFLILVGPLIFGDESADWQSITQLGIGSFGLLAAAAGFIHNTKRLRPRVDLPSNSAIVFPLDSDEQKCVKRVISGKEPPPQNPVRSNSGRGTAENVEVDFTTPARDYSVAHPLNITVDRTSCSSSIPAEHPPLTGIHTRMELHGVSCPDC